MALKELWVESYRPKTIDDYVWIDEGQKRTVQTWINEKYIPHLLLSGGPGTGKSSIFHVIINELKVEPADVMIINASRENGIEMIRQKITNFAQTMPFGDFKIIVLDEADGISPAGQQALRHTMEEYSHVCRFILTCNYPQKILPAIHSRCQSFHFKNLDETEFMIRVAKILAAENVDFDLDTLTAFTKAHYPDLRKTINQVQQYSSSGKLILPANNDDDNGKDYRLEMVSLFRQKRIRDARNLICSQIELEEYNDMYKFLYRNLDFFGANEDQKDEAIMIIRQGIINHSLCADPEINLSATMVELERIGRE